MGDGISLVDTPPPTKVGKIPVGKGKRVGLGWNVINQKDYNVITSMIKNAGIKIDNASDPRDVLKALNQAKHSEQKKLADDLATKLGTSIGRPKDAISDVKQAIIQYDKSKAEFSRGIEKIQDKLYAINKGVIEKRWKNPDAFNKSNASKYVAWDIEETGEHETARSALPGHKNRPGLLPWELDPDKQSPVNPRLRPFHFGGKEIPAKGGFDFTVPDEPDPEGAQAPKSDPRLPKPPKSDPKLAKHLEQQKKDPKVQKIHTQLDKYLKEPEVLRSTTDVLMSSEQLHKIPMEYLPKPGDTVGPYFELPETGGPLTGPHGGQVHFNRKRGHFFTRIFKLPKFIKPILKSHPITMLLPGPVEFFDLMDKSWQSGDAGPLTGGTSHLVPGSYIPVGMDTPPPPGGWTGGGIPEGVQSPRDRRIAMVKEMVKTKRIQNELDLGKPNKDTKWITSKDKQQTQKKKKNPSFGPLYVRRDWNESSK